jgi:lysophospholipase L1-like esterase
MIDEVVNGTTILQGDRMAYDYFGTRTSELSDGVHPSATGAQNLGMMWANAIDRALNPSGTTASFGYAF